MSAALLSRFDLVFILLDKPDELLDKRVSAHIMAVCHSGYRISLGASIILIITPLLLLVDLIEDILMEYFCLLSISASYGFRRTAQFY
jgi:hypothetical protein